MIILDVLNLKSGLNPGHAQAGLERISTELGLRIMTNLVIILRARRKFRNQICLTFL